MKREYKKPVIVYVADVSERQVSFGRAATPNFKCVSLWVYRFVSTDINSLTLKARKYLYKPRSPKGFSIWQFEIKVLVSSSRFI